MLLRTSVVWIESCSLCHNTTNRLHLKPLIVKDISDTMTSPIEISSWSTQKHPGFFIFFAVKEIYSGVVFSYFHHASLFLHEGCQHLISIPALRVLLGVGHCVQVSEKMINKFMVNHMTKCTVLAAATQEDRTYMEQFGWQLKHWLYSGYLVFMTLKHTLLFLLVF